MSRREFITTYVLSARRSGRATDTNGRSERQEIVDVADDLYDLIDKKVRQKGE